MLFPPLPTPRHALFLDFDGTLVDIAAQPQDVALAAATLHDLRTLEAALEGALALVTGRALADIQPHLHDWQPALAGEHGAHWRSAAGCEATGAPPPDLAPIHAALQALSARHPELLVERKSAGVALHYRQAPQLQQLCRDTLTEALRQTSGAELLAGKCVYEVRAAGNDKGRAIARFLQQPPFAGRIPVFVGDDVTDEAGFAAVQAAGGLGVKVGPGESLAHARLDSPTAARAWLHQAAQHLAAATPAAREELHPAPQHP